MRVFAQSSGFAGIALLVAGITAGQAALAPRSSQAIIAVATGGAAVPALILMGAGVVAVPAGGAGILFGFFGQGDGVAYLGLFGVVGGIVAFLTGIVMLDESGAPTPDQLKILPPEARQAGIAPVEAQAFNRSLDRINAVSESIARGIADHKFATAREALDFSRTEWTAAHAHGEIGDAAFSALTKRGALLARKLRK